MTILIQHYKTNYGSHTSHITYILRVQPQSTKLSSNMHQPLHWEALMDSG